MARPSDSPYADGQPLRTTLNTVNAATLAYVDESSGIATTKSQIGAWANPNVGYSTSVIVAAASQFRSARFVPSRNMTVVKIGFVTTVAATTNDSVDVGIYSASGTRLVASGATAGLVNATAGAKTIAIASTTLVAGTAYYVSLAYGAVGGTAASLATFTVANAGMSSMFGATLGVQETLVQAGATLPTTLPAVLASSLCFALAVLES